MNTILKNTISITVITLVAGLALGVVQDITAGPIATQAEKSKEEAYKAVFEDAATNPCFFNAARGVAPVTVSRTPR